jgi:hypothetical protein
MRVRHFGSPTTRQLLGRLMLGAAAACLATACAGSSPAGPVFAPPTTVQETSAPPTALPPTSDPTLQPDNAVDGSADFVDHDGYSYSVTYSLSQPEVPTDDPASSKPGWTTVSWGFSSAQASETNTTSGGHNAPPAGVQIDALFNTSRWACRIEDSTRAHIVMTTAGKKARYCSIELVSGNPQSDTELGPGQSSDLALSGFPISAQADAPTVTGGYWDFVPQGKAHVLEADLMNGPDFYAVTTVDDLGPRACFIAHDFGDGNESLIGELTPRVKVQKCSTSAYFDY